MKFSVYIVKSDVKEKLMSFDLRDQAEAWIENYQQNSRHKRVFEIIEEAS